jgi:hypothetical protein
MKKQGMLLLATFLLGTYVPGAAAGKITEAEKNHCAAAYKTYCGEYGLETAALRDCMNRNGGSLSNSCVEALISAGEISRGEVERRRKGSSK